MKRFLDDENGNVESVELSCLKPKVGLGTVMEEPPNHCPDIWRWSYKRATFKRQKMGHS